MASVSVVHYNTSPHKVLQQSNNSSERREIIILRKNPHILPQPKDYNKEDILITNTNRKKKTTKDNLRTAPQPVAVARRNARERNRVKQVNNGFANLRQHIPNFIASAFESSTRGGSKKLSKVETLRMAVEYIRSLEDILAMDDNSETGNTSNNSSVSSFLSQSPSIQPYQIMSPSADEDDNTSTPPPQYIRIDTTTNTYQIIPAHLYDDSENLEPLDAEILSDLEFGGGSQDLLAGNSLSPGMYSEQSLSPGVMDKGDGYGTIFDASGKLVQVKREDVSRDIPVISLKTEHELPQQHKTNVIDVMQWWEQQQSPHHS